MKKIVTSEMSEKIKQLRINGCSVALIAERFGLSNTTVRNILKDKIIENKQK